MAETDRVRTGKETEVSGPANVVEHATCLLCGARSVEEFLKLGEMALANKFVTTAELGSPDPRYPLRVGFCHTCAHVQLMDLVTPSAMFQDYLYMSSASETLKQHLADLAATVARRCALGPADLVVDVGCNDGSLLGCFRRLGVRTLGVDPAENLAAIHQDSGIDRLVAYFTPETANQIVDRVGQASAITITNTFPHFQDLRQLVEAVKILLKPGGSLVIEAHYLRDLLEQGAFDTVYHEHVSYWALGPMQYLFEHSGMQVVNAERLPLHHGQLRATVRRRGEIDPAPAVERLIAEERAAGLDRVDTYRDFAARVGQIRRDLLATLQQLKADNKRVAAYGAPAKGNTLIEFLQLTRDTVQYIADKSPLKQGKYSPGAHIPVVPPERLLQDQPDYVVLLAWNFRDEILEQQAEYRRRGGKFIAPLPEVRVY
jgi:SAM-dependent methyltransferase